VDFTKIEQKRINLFQSYKKKRELGFLLLVAGLAIVLIFSVIIAVYINTGPIFIISLVIGVLLNLTAAIFLFLAYRERKNFENSFCHHIEREVIDVLYEAPVFVDEDKIDLSEIMSFELVDQPDRYQISNHFVSKYKKVEIEMAKIALEKEEKQKKKIVHKAYFSGFFIHLKMKMPFKGTLLIKEAEFWEKESDTEFEKFEVSSAEFNQKIKMYTSSKELAKHILKDQVVKCLTNIALSGGSQISLVVKDENSYLIFNNQTSCFKPKIKEILNEASLKPVIEQFTLPKDLIDAIG